MTYPASPNDAGDPRVRLDSAQFWAGGLATAIVAALIALAGILICRWTLGIPILAPAGAGAWGNAHTGEYVLAAALVALVATAVLYLLVLGTPQPGMFFSWIMGLLTLVAVVYPFSTGAPLDQKAATAIVNLVLGIAITSLLNAVAARAIRIRRATRVRRPPSSDPRYDRPPYDRPPSSRTRVYEETEPIDRAPGSWR
jgi:uncharacterized membrane protein YhaH (DUF805 family)